MSGGMYALVGGGLAVLAAALGSLVIVVNQRIGDLRADLSARADGLDAQLRDLRSELRADRDRAERRHEEIMARLTVVEGARS